MIRTLLLTAILAAPAWATSPLPFDVGGPFTLVDQDGTERTEADPDGHPQILFFGYANCQEICSAVLPMMADITDALADRGLTVRPVMITTDPERDTVEAIGPALRQLHPDFVGLTGTPEALQVAYDAYHVEVKELFSHPEIGTIYTHGSFVYVLDGAGTPLTLFPPVLSSDAAAELVLKYVEEAS